MYIFDLDNTLIYTDVLNNHAYNHALSVFNLPEITNVPRITRGVISKIYPHFGNIKEVVDIKQAYFLNHLNETILNKDVANMLNVLQVEQCILWTSAEPSRAIALLDYYKLTNKFKKIIYSEKINIMHDVQDICLYSHCKQEDLVFYEDNTDILKILKKLNFSVCEIV